MKTKILIVLRSLKDCALNALLASILEKKGFVFKQILYAKPLIREMENAYHVS